MKRLWTAPRRLRWQLTVSHLAAIACTLMLMVAAIVVITNIWYAVQTSPFREPALDARLASIALSGTFQADPTPEPDELRVLLRSMASGRLRIQPPMGLIAGEQARRGEGGFPGLRRVAYIVVLEPDGTILATSESSEGKFDALDRQAWAELHRRVTAGETDARRLVAVEGLDGRGPGRPGAIGAAPIVGPDDALLGVVVVGKYGPPPMELWATIARGLAFFGAATATVLVLSFVFAMGSASVLAYFLSKRLAGRLEQLGLATESLAAGELDQRVVEGPPDEVGQLARRFNRMADRLSTTIVELEVARHDAEQALQARRELVANVSHELRTPLASIRGHVESVVLRSIESARTREDLAIVEREVERLSSLVDDLFVLATTDANGLPLDIDEVDVSAVVQETAAAMGPLARRQSRVSLVTDGTDAPRLVRADRERVTQVLQNLVRNAIRYTPEGGIVSIGVAANGSSVRVEVSDTGPGISADHLDHIFDRFYRADPARDRASGGAGLGLAIVKELVEAMGGVVGARSTLGEGSTFWFDLPSASDP
jgi:signal transduction histidine kinase